MLCVEISQVNNFLSRGSLYFLEAALCGNSRARTYMPWELS